MQHPCRWPKLKRSLFQLRMPTQDKETLVARKGILRISENLIVFGSTVRELFLQNLSKPTVIAMGKYFISRTYALLYYKLTKQILQRLGGGLLIL